MQVYPNCKFLLVFLRKQGPKKLPEFLTIVYIEVVVNFSYSSLSGDAKLTWNFENIAEKTVILSKISINWSAVLEGSWSLKIFLYKLEY